MRCPWSFNIHISLDPQENPFGKQIYSLTLNAFSVSLLSSPWFQLKATFDPSPIPDSLVLRADRSCAIPQRSLSLYLFRPPPGYSHPATRFSLPCAHLVLLLTRSPLPKESRAEIPGSPECWITQKAFSFFFFMKHFLIWTDKHLGLSLCVPIYKVNYKRLHRKDDVLAPSGKPTLPWHFKCDYLMSVDECLQMK